MAEELVKLTTEIDGVSHNNQAVVKLNPNEHQQIKSARLADGSLKIANYYISNMEVILTYEDKDISWLITFRKWLF